MNKTTAVLAIHYFISGYLAAGKEIHSIEDHIEMENKFLESTDDRTMIYYFNELIPELREMIK